MKQLAVRLKKSTPDDLDEIYQMETQIFRKDSFSREQYRELLTESNAITLNAVLQGRIIGVIGARVRRNGKQTYGIIETIQVLPKYRNTGIATKLIQAIVKLLANRRASYVILQVRRTNYKARNLYKQLGFTEYEVLQDYYGEREDGLEMRKPFDRVKLSGLSNDLDPVS